MTINQLIDLLNNYPIQIVTIFILLPLFSLIYGKIHGKGLGVFSPHKYVYAGLIYASCAPGVLALVLAGYILLFTRFNLLEVNILIYFGPIISMIITLAIIRHNVELKYVPGFDRLIGLFTLLGVVFILSLLVSKMRIWILFGSSIFTLLVIMIVLFLVLKWATHKLFRKKM